MLHQSIALHILDLMRYTRMVALQNHLLHRTYNDIPYTVHNSYTIFYQCHFLCYRVHIHSCLLDCHPLKNIRYNIDNGIVRFYYFVFYILILMITMILVVGIFQRYAFLNLCLDFGLMLRILILLQRDRYIHEEQLIERKNMFHLYKKYGFFNLITIILQVQYYYNH